jgi:hypothetical protein
MNGSGGPPLSIILSFYRQWVSMALERIQIATILHQAIATTKEVLSRLDVLLGFSLIFLHDLLCVMSDGFRS